jgi:hypothetical protein
MDAYNRKDREGLPRIEVLARHLSSTTNSHKWKGHRTTSKTGRLTSLHLHRLPGWKDLLINLPFHPARWSDRQQGKSILVTVPRAEGPTTFCLEEATIRGKLYQFQRLQIS